MEKSEKSDDEDSIYNENDSDVSSQSGQSEIDEHYDMEEQNIDSKKKSTVPIYVQRAQQKYYNKIRENPEYIEKKKLATVEWRKEHREEYNQYMREYRQRKKAENIKN